MIDKMCKCGCGQKTTLCKRTYTKRGFLKGDYRNYIHGHNQKNIRLSIEHRRKIGLGNTGKKRSADTRKKMSISKLKNPPRYWLGKKRPNLWNGKREDFRGRIGFWAGKKRSKDTIRKISLGNKGKKHTEESKRKISLGNKGKHYQILSIETKRKISINTKKAMKNFDIIRKIKEYRKTQILPLKDTSIEIKIQNFLKQLNIPFFTHQYRNEIKHSYQCDIFIPSKNMVLECDGNYWHHYPTGTEIDHIRTSELIEKGFKVLRLWEFEIKKMELNEFKERLNTI